MKREGHDERTRRNPGPGAPAVQLRVWHLALLVLFVAVAIKNIQDQRRSEPALIALAVSGFVAYGVLGWLGWRCRKPVRKADSDRAAA